MGDVTTKRRNPSIPFLKGVSNMWIFIATFKQLTKWGNKIVATSAAMEIE